MRVKRFLLAVRLTVEAIFGTICLVDLLLLPGIWKDRDHVALALGELFGVVVVILIGILCFKDVVRIARVLKATPSDSLPNSN
ncbi:hypothetical protein HDF09_000859 [Edaphobacter lichenicola]|uniref:Uncharacterized protein n=1 Tax=Tunturiibacter empetritectus TaxID=3069691 RepID=A0A7W8IFF2_9BACT|nr:hypothetical protein [Edaphobacter lichenicola]